MKLDKDDYKALTADLSGTVQCPNCGEWWESPYPNTRKICPSCFKKLGYEYID